MKRSFAIAVLVALRFPGVGLAQTEPTVGGVPVSKYLAVPASVGAARLPVDPALGYGVSEVADQFYIVTDGIWQSGFLVTQNGVVLLDAPGSFGATLPDIVRSITDRPITHLIYSHAHKDHIGAAGALTAVLPNLTIIAHERVGAYLLDMADPNRPVPNETFRGSRTLKVGGALIELDEVGPYHSVEADMFITLPRQGVLYAIDSYTPGWVTFQGLDLTMNIHNYLALGDEVMSRDWEIFVGGHLTQLGTRDQIQASIDYTDDALAVATDVIRSTDMMATMGQAAEAGGWSNPFLLFRYYLDSMAEACAARLVQRWGGVLAGVDVWAASHCDRLLAYLRVD
ncbi:MAG: MBL fold metallo-hydrolase [Gemmatimonadota bacterium]|nr:MBL fold metallo-hydrolase [Gemmatimonadota bacterium]MDH5197779.1 MBL fold metallo-hydrolase [Gemmatimonadota bacterium]